MGAPRRAHGPAHASRHGGAHPGGGDYVGKPRPAAIIQDDNFDQTSSITLCVFTSDPVKAPLFRLLVEPSESNGLHAPSSLMVDKVTTVPKSKLGARVGKLDDADLLRLNQAIIVFLGLAGSSRSRS